MQEASNLPKGKTNIRPKNDPSRIENFDAIKFTILNTYLDKFHLLRLNYAKQHKDYGFSNNKMLLVSILFLYDKFNREGILLEAPEGFNKAILRTGSRKRNNRSYPKALTKSITIKVHEVASKKYLDLMFSFISNAKDQSVFEDHHSRNYFFYDFIDLLDLNKKEFFKFYP